MKQSLQLWARVQRNCCFSLSVCLQMGRGWMCWGSETESASESEKNSDFQSLLSWDSSLDLEVGSWRNSEERAIRELEESSQEEDCRQFSESLWEDDSDDCQEVVTQCDQESLLHFLTEVGLSALYQRGNCPVFCLKHDQLTLCSLCRVQLSWDNPLQRLLFKRTLLSIWKVIASHRYSGPFLKAVSDKQAPGYSDVVKRPMDLTSIKRNLSKGHIHTSAQFQRDLMLMFQNAVMYNSSSHHVHRMAVEMQQEVLEQLQMLGEALLCSGDRLGWGRR
uniref:Bromo domain-containing protein n=1 Tax=Nothoprocta perdicaria TaxID=30464 RepID=A0A8C6YUF3_NOTPE